LFGGRFAHLEARRAGGSARSSVRFGDPRRL
jgi:hypothetical protein